MSRWQKGSQFPCLCKFGECGGGSLKRLSWKAEFGEFLSTWLGLKSSFVTELWEVHVEHFAIPGGARENEVTVPPHGIPQMCWHAQQNYYIRAGLPLGHSEQINALAACRARGWHRTCTAPDNALHFTDEAAEARGAKQLAQDCSWLVVGRPFKETRETPVLSLLLYFSLLPSISFLQINSLRK